MDVLQTPASPGERTNCRGLQPPAGLSEVDLNEASLFFMSISFKESFKVLTGENLSDLKKRHIPFLASVFRLLWSGRWESYCGEAAHK